MDPKVITTNGSNYAYVEFDVRYEEDEETQGGAEEKPK
jgi:hypothetical protein